MPRTTLSGGEAWRADPVCCGEGGGRECVTLLLAWAETRGDKAGQGGGRTPSPEAAPADGDWGCDG